MSPTQVELWFCTVEFAKLRFDVKVRPRSILVSSLANQKNPMNNNLKNKRALVTGGSRGIGAGIVKRLANEGVNVAFTYSSSPDAARALAKSVQAFGVKALAI